MLDVAVENPARWTTYTRKARAAIEAYEAALTAKGLVIAPREPTEAMYKAGGEAKPFGGPAENWTPGQIIAATVWRAMVAAAPERAPG